MLGQSLRWIWASPTTFFGALVATGTLVTGGAWRRRGWVIEVWGGFATWLLTRHLVRAEAMTLGHIILGRSPRSLDLYRNHELQHVRQTELWGGFFLPAYCVASLWAYLTGRHYYRDNWFEIDANRRENDASG